MLHVYPLSSIPTAPLLSALSCCNAPFSKSMLYETLTETKVLDPDKRNSLFRELRGEDAQPLFNHIETHVLANIPGNTRFSLVRNDATHIKYEEGGFFKSHKDYCSVESPCIIEYTMIISLAEDRNGNAVLGGGTTITNNGIATTYDNTTTPGGGLLFRKDLEHAGEVLVSGEKEVLTFNIWAFTGQDSAGVVHITFGEGDEAETGNEDDTAT